MDKCILYLEDECNSDDFFRCNQGRCLDGAHVWRIVHVGMVNVGVLGKKKEKNNKNVYLWIVRI